MAQLVLDTIRRAMHEERGLREKEAALLSRALEAERDALVKAGLQAALFLLAEEDTWRALGSLPRAFGDRPLWWWMVATQSEDERVEALVDRVLGGADAAAMIDALARAKAVWDHEALDRALEREGAGEAAALVMAGAEPELVEEAWVNLLEERGEDALELVLAQARVVTLHGEGDVGELLVELREDLAEAGPAMADAVARVDAILACESALGYARGVMGGVLGMDWMSDARLVTDVLSMRQGTTWLEALACLDGADEDAFAFAALIAVASAAHAPEEDEEGDGEGDGEAERGDAEAQAGALIDLLDLLRDGDAGWEAQATLHGFQVPLALADEDNVALLVECAIHERLLTLGVEAPPISVFPLSGADADALLLDDALALCEAAGEDDALPLVRTLCDARRWSRESPQALRGFLDDPRVRALTSHAHAAVQRAAKWLFDEAPLHVSGPESPGALARAIAAMDLATLASLGALYQQALVAPLSRNAALTALTWDLLEEL